MSGAHNSSALHYFVPGPSKWPLVGAIAMVFNLFGAVGMVNHRGWGYALFAVGMVILTYVLYGWFRDVAHESESGKYGHNIELSYRWSMSWFIFSEVMFFGAFFGALYYAREISTPWLADLDSRSVLWPDFAGGWPNLGPAELIEKFQTIGPFPLPTINTLLLLASGVTLTIAHHALLANRRGALKFWLLATVLLGFTFLGCQGYEYLHAYRDLNLKLTSGIYGSTFFMLTGFHGFHVTIGAIILTVIWFRVLNGHFTPQNHFGFEGAAWYWHFVDVVWLLLYVVVYWL